MNETTNNRGLRWIACLTIAWAVALAVGAAIHNHRFLHDDAFITLRYARHMDEGLGPLWNRGGPRVEGFTSPLHMLLIAGLGAMHVPLLTADRALNVFFHLVLVAAVWIAVRRSSGRLAGALAAGLTLCCFPLIVWDFGGLDAVPFGALTTLGLLIGLRYFEGGAQRDLNLGGFVLGLAIFTRPDAAVAAIVLLGGVLVAARGSFAERARAALLCAGCCVAAALPWEIFRIAYFHDVLPNTYYAKVYGIPLGFRVHSGLAYLRTSLHIPPYLMLLTPLAFVYALLRDRLTRADVVLYGYIALYAAYIVTSGGDYMIAYRFFAGFAPVMIVVIVRTLARSGALDAPALALATTAIAAFLAALQFRRFELNPVLRESASLVGEVEGTQLADHWPAGAVVGMNFTGAIPYFADRYNYIDMLGLNDVAVAHRHPMPVDGPWVHLIGHIKGDGRSVLDRRPDVLFLGGGVLYGDKYVPMIVGDWEMVHDPRFAEYKPCRIPVVFPPKAYEQLGKIGYPPSLTLFAYQRRDLSWPCDPPTQQDWARWSTEPHPEAPLAPSAQTPTQKVD